MRTGNDNELSTNMILYIFVAILPPRATLIAYLLTRVKHLWCV